MLFLAIIDRRVNRQSPCGDLRWQGRISKEFGLESTLRKRGRPRKDDKSKKKVACPPFSNRVECS